MDLNCYKLTCERRLATNAQNVVFIGHSLGCNAIVNLMNSYGEHSRPFLLLLFDPLAYRERDAGEQAGQVSRPITRKQPTYAASHQLAKARLARLVLRTVTSYLPGIPHGRYRRSYARKTIWQWWLPLSDVLTSQRLTKGFLQSKFRTIPGRPMSCTTIGKTCRTIFSAA